MRYLIKSRIEFFFARFQEEPADFAMREGLFEGDYLKERLEIDIYSVIRYVSEQFIDNKVVVEKRQ